MLRYTLCCFLLISLNALHAQAPKMYSLGAEVGKSFTYELDLAEGQPLTDLSWAWNSSVACFVEPREEFFTGNHLFAKTEIPKYSTMVIRLIPKDKRQNMSLYAYSGGHGQLPPTLPSCISCEADYHQEQPSVNRPRPDHTRSVELRAVTRPYPVTIGVAGANGLATGDFVLEITVTKNR